MNQCNFTGRMAADPEPLAGSTPGCRFRVAVDAYNSKTKTKDVDWIPCVAFGRTAEVIQQYAEKGRPVQVTGKLKFREWTTSTGDKRKDASILVDQFELLPGSSPSNKPQQQATADPDPDPSGLW